MNFRSQLMIGLIATTAFPLISFGTDVTTSGNTTRIYSETEIKYIHDMNCDTFTSEAKTRCLDIKKTTLSQSTTANSDKPMPPIKIENDSNNEHIPMSPVSNSDITLPKPPMPTMGTGVTNNRLLLPAVQKRGGSDNNSIVGGGPGGGPHVRMMKGETGANVEDQIYDLGIAIGRLTPADRDTLIKMIREYLISKGLTLGAPEVKKDETERKGWDGSIKGKKTDTEIQTGRATLLEKAKTKREAMKKEYVGHVTLMK